MIIRKIGVCTLHISACAIALGHLNTKRGIRNMKYPGSGQGAGRKSHTEGCFSKQKRIDYQTLNHGLSDTCV